MYALLKSLVEDLQPTIVNIKLYFKQEKGGCLLVTVLLAADLNYMHNLVVYAILCIR